MTKHDSTADTDQTQSTPAPAPMLTSTEARILGSLMEKQWATPNSYPLTLNSLVLACNQKTSRHPVMHLEPGEVGHTLHELQDRKLVAVDASGRAERYSQRLDKALELDREEQAIVCVMMLRGPQTLHELRSNTVRLAEFADLSAVQDALELSMAHEPSLVIQLPRVAGQREERYAQLLCGEVDIESLAATAPRAATPPGGDRITALETRIQRLQDELNTLWRLTGLQDQRPPDDNQSPL